jgi:hypothetical protein
MLPEESIFYHEKLDFNYVDRKNKTISSFGKRICDFIFGNTVTIKESIYDRKKKNKKKKLNKQSGYEEINEKE